jgi:2-dehydro-3-deoxyphosphogluconate aldolase/(4S)-4-hydroxy-2-oxoglutarate aldolase
MNRSEIRAQIEEVGILPSVRVTSEEHARFAAETVFAAGIPVVEITLTVPGALNVVNELAKRYPNVPAPYWTKSQLGEPSTPAPDF